MNILLTGGGTGGHVIPNIAIYESLKDENIKVSYMGSKNSIEERLCTKYNIPFFEVTCVKFSRDKLLSNFKIPYLLLKGISEAKTILKEHHFDLVFSKGGYVSLPCCLASKSQNIRIITHESDATLGLANKIISRFADALITNNDNIKSKVPTYNLGNPIRKKILSGNKDIVLQDMRYDKNKKFLLIVGGSSGASFLNSLVRDNIDILTQRYNVLHLTGKGNNNISHNCYKGVDFADNIEDYYALADLVISRSGAGAISELSALSKKCLYIPLSKKASRGDQIINANLAVQHGNAKMLEEDNANILAVMNTLKELETLESLHTSNPLESNEKIVDLIKKYASNK